MVRNLFILIALLVGGSAFLGSAEIGRIGIVDMDRVYGSYRQEASQLKELEDLQKKLQLDIDRGVVELEVLKTEKTQAQSRGDSNRVRQLDSQINQKANQLQNLYQQGNRQLENKKTSTLENDQFAKRVITVIRSVAESEGYTHVLKKSSLDLLYYNPGFDITDQVIKQLNAGR